jgi:uncharacterized protein (DUF305 family)
MTIRAFVFALPLSWGLAGATLAQPHDHGAMQGSVVDLPEACKAAASGNEAMTRDMHGHMAQAMQGMSGQATEAQKGLQQAMMKMNGPMMQGMMAGDADDSWICAMIPHHQGAIDMARVGLKTGDNPEAKKIA